MKQDINQIRAIFVCIASSANETINCKGYLELKEKYGREISKISANECNKCFKSSRHISQEDLKNDIIDHVVRVRLNKQV